MNKDNIYKIAKIIVFITLALFILMKFDNVLSFKNEASDQFYPYYNEKSKLDVVFAGTSAGAHGFNTMHLWNEFGITSYNMSGSGQYYKNSYYIIKEAIRIKKPKVIVLDVHYLLHLQDLAGASIKLYNMHVSQDRYDGFKDIFPSKKLNEFLSYHQFHTRWKVLKNYDFYMYPYSIFKGYAVHAGLFISKYPKINNPQDKVIQSLLDDTILYTNKIVALCKENNINVIFIKLPQALDNLQKSRNQLFSEYCKKNNITFIDFNTLIDTTGIDYNKDFLDAYHLNIYGAAKVTSYLGKYIQDNYHIADKRNNEDYNDWNNEYMKYQFAVKSQSLKTIDNLTEWQNQALDKNYVIMISSHGNNLDKLPENIKESFKLFGLKKYETKEKNMRYAAIINNNKVEFEYINTDPVLYNGIVKNTKANVYLSSEPIVSHTKVNGTAYGKSKEGINITVYNKVNNKVIDNMWVDFQNPYNINR